MVRTERDLIALALSLVGDKRRLSAKERKLTADLPPALPHDVRKTRDCILAGGDPLGDAFCNIRSPEQRRPSGAIYTPELIVQAMTEWASQEIDVPVRVIDPGTGSGRFLWAAAERFPKAQLLAVEIDPVAALLIRANASVLGFAGRLTVFLNDYRLLKLPKTNGATLFIGNPPYVRHHGISETWKSWFADSAAEFGIKASKLAGLHIHFFLKTHQLGRPGDFGSFITAAEWLDVNYGSALRKMLADKLGGTALHIIAPEALPFPGAMTTGAITCFRIGNRPEAMTVRSVERLEDLSLEKGVPVCWGDLSDAPRWSHFIRGSVETDPDSIELGDLFRVHRGQVTGKNGVWIENPLMKGIPIRYLHATVTRARDLISAGEILKAGAPLRRVLDLPTDLDELDRNERKAVDHYLKWARDNDAHSGFVAKHRKAWWSVQLRAPAPILCTYMARSAPTFVRNRADARHINIAHGLYPREKMSENDLSAILRYLRRAVTTAGGRTYAGGLVKFEPRELERLRVPTLERLHDVSEALV